MGYQAVCLFGTDDANQKVLAEVAEMGVEILALRCDNVDLGTAKIQGIQVVRVSAYQRTRDAIFRLIGFNVRNRTAGITGMGKIGLATMRILKFFVCAYCVSTPILSHKRWS